MPIETVAAATGTLRCVPIYLVRWPDLSVSVIQAKDEEHLQELLDHLADPSLAIWVEYDGPLWFEFEPNVRRKRNGGARINSAFRNDPAPTTVWKPGKPEFDVSNEMFEVILDRLFPHLRVAVQQADPDEMDNSAFENGIATALEKEQWHEDSLDERDGPMLPPSLVRTMLHSLKRQDTEGSQRDIRAQRREMSEMLDRAEVWHDDQLERLEAERQRARRGG